MNARSSGLLAAFTFAVALALSGCAAHVALPRAPPRDAPYVVRVQAYNAFRPMAVQYTTVVSYGRYGSSSSTSATGLLLANGATITHPEDLLPLAGEPSPMSQEARESQRTARIGSALVWSGLGATLLGGALAVGGIWALFTGGSNVGVPIALAGGFLVLTGPIPWITGAVYGGVSARHRETAYQMYGPSLRQNLGLCGDGTQIGDCPGMGYAPVGPGGPMQPFGTPMSLRVPPQSVPPSPPPAAPPPPPAATPTDPNAVPPVQITR